MKFVLLLIAAALVVLLVLVVAVQAARIRNLRNIIAASKDPVMGLPRRERRARYREELERRDEELDLAQLKNFTTPILPTEGQ